MGNELKTECAYSLVEVRMWELRGVVGIGGFCGDTQMEIDVIMSSDGRFKIDFEVWAREEEVPGAFCRPQEMWKLSLSLGILVHRMLHVAPGNKSHKSAMIERWAGNYMSH